MCSVAFLCFYKYISPTRSVHVIMSYSSFYYLVLQSSKSCYTHTCYNLFMSHFLFIFCLQIDYASLGIFCTELQPTSVSVFTQFILLLNLFLHTAFSRPLFAHELENQQLSFSLFRLYSDAIAFLKALFIPLLSLSLSSKNRCFIILLFCKQNQLVNYIKTL